MEGRKQCYMKMKKSVAPFGRNKIKVVVITSLALIHGSGG